MEEKINKGTRISKVLARAGLCSRREAERWILSGRVAVGNVTLKDPAFNVLPRDEILIDGNPIPQEEPTRLWRYHKPAGLISSNNDPQKRATIFEKLPTHLPRVMSIGRLDLNSEGLLLLTNDGDLARRLELPKMGWTRRYRVRVYGHVDRDRLDSLKKGISLGGVQYGPMEVTIETKMGRNSWLLLTLREGKNREIRNVMENFGLNVNRLIRVAFGPFQLGKLSRGSVVEIPPKVLRENLKIRVNLKKNKERGF